MGVALDLTLTGWEFRPGAMHALPGASAANSSGRSPDFKPHHWSWSTKTDNYDRVTAAPATASDERRQATNLFC